MTATRKLEFAEVAALSRYATAHGPLWVQTLASVNWYNARIWTGGMQGDGNILHALRNDPRWGHTGLAMMTARAVRIELDKDAGEYRVPGPAKTDAQAYYTDDKADAIGTCIDMHARVGLVVRCHIKTRRDA